MTQPPPRYPLRAIVRLDKLALVLGVSLDLLLAVSKDASSRYRLAKLIVKPDGSTRQPLDAKVPLKGIQRRIKERILEKVVFPDYLTGSLKGRDARANARLHIGAAIVLSEDIANFFPSTKDTLVFKIWRHFFGFAPEVAEILTSLTTKDGELPQGACTSSYLANLAFWREEHRLYEVFRAQGIAYSRYVDDVSVSSKRRLSNEELSACIKSVYGMMGRSGFRPRRKKQEIQRANSPMLVTKLLANRRPAISVKERQAIRASLYQLEQSVAGRAGDDLRSKLESIAGRVNRLCQMHPVEGERLKARVRVLRGQIGMGASEVCGPVTGQ